MSFQYSTQDELTDHIGSLLEEEAGKVRVVLKYHNGKKEMTFRATDDEVCLKFNARDREAVAGTERLLETAIAGMCELSPEELTRQREAVGAGTDKKRRKKKATRS